MNKHKDLSYWIERGADIHVCFCLLIEPQQGGDAKKFLKILLLFFQEQVYVCAPHTNFENNQN